MEQHEDEFVTHAQLIWEKQQAVEELICWGSRAIINEGDFYYECAIDIILYGVQMDMPRPVLTETEYFRQKLRGFTGFNYYDDKKNN